MRSAFLLSFGLLFAAASRGAVPDLLEDSAKKWLGERDHWAFLQRAKEYNRDGTTYERIERYDPSQAGNARWELLTINGQSPTAEQRAAWEKKKFKKNRRKFDSPLSEYFDFDQARLLSQEAKAATFRVPLRNDKNWLFPTDKVDVTVTINKETHALEHLTAKVREPFKVLLGIARITDGAVDLGFDDSPDAEPSVAKPNGTVSVSVFRFGERIDFEWSEFRRVVPASSNSPAAK